MAEATICDRNCPMRGENCHKGCKNYLIGKIMRELEARPRKKAIETDMFIAASTRKVRSLAKKYRKKR